MPWNKMLSDKQRVQTRRESFTWSLRQHKQDGHGEMLLCQLIHSNLFQRSYLRANSTNPSLMAFDTQRPQCKSVEFQNNNFNEIQQAKSECLSLFFLHCHLFHFRKYQCQCEVYFTDIRILFSFSYRFVINHLGIPYILYSVVPHAVYSVSLDSQKIYKFVLKSHWSQSSWTQANA